MRLPKWRKATWAIAIWSAIMLLWAVAGGNSANSSCKAGPSNGLSAHTVSDACDVGTGLGVAIIVVLWFVGFIVLALVWLMSRPKVQQVVMISPEQAAAAGYTPILTAPAAPGATPARAAAVDVGLDFVPLTEPVALAMTPRTPSPPGSPLGPYGR